MKTKYILHGGFNPSQPYVSDAFFSEILKDSPAEPKILLVYFAKEDRRRDKNRLEDIEQFAKNNNDKLLNFEVAEVNTFIGQILNSNIVYVHGGDTGLLQERLQGFSASELETAFQGKTIAGDSAGANVLVKAFYSLKIGAGLGFGILPIKLLCHYSEENKHELDHLYKETETIHLKEYEYKVFYKDNDTMTV